MAVDFRLSKRFLKSLEVLSDDDHGRVEGALQQLQQQWGAPHVHTGLSNRRLHAGYYECRAGLELRVVFRVTRDGLDLVIAGNHDTVRRLIHGL